MRPALLAALAALVLVLAAPLGAAAAVFTVTRPDDPASPPACAPEDCSLRAAFAAAAASPGRDTISVPAGTFTLAQGPLPLVTEGLALRGAGATATTITGGVATGGTAPLRAGVLTANGASVLVADLTLSGNRATVDAPGVDTLQIGAGAIAVNAGRLTLVDVIVAGNELAASATVGAGGVAAANAAVSVQRTNLSGNTASVGGQTIAGGLALGGAAGTLLLVDSTVAGNLATSPASLALAGGVALNLSLGELENATISGNRAAPAAAAGLVGGGLVSSAGALTAAHVTLALNVAEGADADGGNLAVGGTADRSLANSLVAGGSSPSGGNCGGTVESLGGNVEDRAECGFTGNRDRSSVDTGLAPLAANGGATPTHGLLAASAAINAGATQLCSASDQRGLPRPQGSGCDSGAFELAAPSSDGPPTIAGDPVVGATLTCTPGTWTNATELAFTWVRDGVPTEVTTATYALTDFDASTAVQCRVTGSSAAGRSSSISPPLAISPAPPPEPEGAPEIRGGARVGNRVSCQVGPWLGSPTIEVAWLVDGIENGAASAAYRITAQDVGHALQCKAIATTPTYVVESFSAPVVVKLACIVPKVKGLALADARARLERARCAVGKVTTTRAKGVAAGQVVSTKPPAGKNLPAGAKVALVLAR